jgi:D-alanyl-D-alanine carboxypeptidase
MHASKLTYIILPAVLLTVLVSGCQDNDSNSSKPKSKPSAQISSAPHHKPTKNGATPTGTVHPSVTPQTNNNTQESIPVVRNVTSLEVMVNKHRALPANYVPTDLIQPNVSFSFSGTSEKKLLRKPAALALEKLFEHAKSQGILLNGVSGYRSYVTQSSIFNGNVKRQGYAEARRFSAIPGTSEHQTGLAIDVSSPSVGNALEQTFGNSNEGKWLALHCAEFGFIIRYPNGKEAITGYAYEPWHIRYVGVEMAQKIMAKGLTLEEYFGNAAPATKVQ